MAPARSLRCGGLHGLDGLYSLPSTTRQNSTPPLRRKEDPTSWDHVIHAMDPSVSKQVVALDLVRGKKRHDLTQDEPWNSLCTKAAKGEVW